MHFLPSRKRTWTINAWLSVNGGLFCWFLFPTASWLLLLFPATEPAAFGTLWINEFFFFLSMIASGRGKGMTSPRRLLAPLCVLIAGISLQAYLIGWQWQKLVMLDNGFRKLRIWSIQWLCWDGYVPDHRVVPTIMWFAWMLFILSNRQPGPIVPRLARKPPFSVDESTPL